MQERCTNAVKVGASILKDYRLTFRSGVATIEKCKGASVPIGIWTITKDDEISLDIYEGFPNFYIKWVFPVQLSGKKIYALVYLMRGGEKNTPVSKYYLDIIMQGYQDFGFEPESLLQAVNKNR